MNNNRIFVKNWLRGECAQLGTGRSTLAVIVGSFAMLFAI